MHVKRILIEVEEMFPSIDILVNNASPFYPTRIDDVSEDPWKKINWE
jgi:Dehydrogenases with different specificities (related to short-chain alcohol dehydrogenases)